MKTPSKHVSFLELALLCLIFPGRSQSQSYGEAPEKWSKPLKISILSGHATYLSVPSLTSDGKTMYLCWDNKILFSTKTDTDWTMPISLNDSINSPGTITEAPSISPDGKTLYFRRYVGEWRILCSKWNDSLALWGTPSDMGININEFGAWYGMTPDNQNFYFHRPGGPRVSEWSDSLKLWGPSQWIDNTKFYSAYQVISVPASKRKVYYDSYAYNSDLYVNYFDTLSKQWSYPLALNINLTMDTSSDAKGLQQFAPWITSDGRQLYFSSDHDGEIGIWVSNLIVDENGDSLTSGVEGIDLPRNYELDQNFPNPFNPCTTISYAVPEYSLVQLRVVDLLGREIATLVNEIQWGGKHEIGFDGSALSSGAYLYFLKVRNHSLARKMLLVK